MKLEDEQFIKEYMEPDEYGRSLLDYNNESIGEHEAQYRSEVALYGDAGPGQGLALAEMKADDLKVRRRLVSLGIPVHIW